MPIAVGSGESFPLRGSIDRVDEAGETALMFAADKCDRETLRMLLKAEAKLKIDGIASTARSGVQTFLGAAAAKPARGA